MNLQPDFTTTDAKLTSQLMQVEAINDTAAEGYTFPKEAFNSKAIYKILTDMEAGGLSPDYAGLTMLAVLSAAIGNRFRVRRANGQQETAMLYALVVGPTGSRKTPVFKILLSPLNNRQKVYIQQHNEAIAAYKKELAAWNAAAQDKGQEPAAPIGKKIVITDVTPEAMAQKLKENPVGVLQFSDEYLAVLKNLNRYTNGSGMEMIMQIWDGKEISIDRKSNDGTLYVEEPFCTQLGGIQPEVKHEFTGGGRLSNGHNNRYLYAYPYLPPKPAYWDEDKNQKTVDTGVWDTYVNRILDLPVNIEGDIVKPGILEISTEAKQVFYKWQRPHADELADIDDHVLRGYYSKLETYALRIALILQILQHVEHGADTSFINEDSARGAVALIEYFKYTGERFLLSNEKAAAANKKDEKRVLLYNVLPNDFKSADAQKTAKGLGITARTFQRYLAEYGDYIKVKQGHYKKAKK